MTGAEARSRIEHLTQWEAAPALTEAEVDWLLESARVTDENGIEPGEDDYEDTYTFASTNAAISLGWDMKAGKVAGQYDIKSGEDEIKRSQQMPALTGRARSYRSAGGIGSITLTTAIAEASD